MALEPRHNPDASRYELFEDGVLVGVADYRLDGQVAVFPHTEVVAPRRGHGLGERLVRFALDDQRRLGHTVIARCWFVAEFIDDHPEYADLRATA
jgi:uncharacterized protein